VAECTRIRARSGAAARERELILGAAAITDLREAAQLLRGYVKSGSIGANTEDYSVGKLVVFGAWHHVKPGDMWHGVPCPLADEAERLRQCLQIDAWRAAPAEADQCGCGPSSSAAAGPG
jgi:hypothetical protein